MAIITGTFTGLADPPQVVSAEVLGDVLRVHFSEPMQLNADLVNPGNYVITEAMGSVARSAVSVVASDEYVDITVDGQFTIGVGNYDVQVALVVDLAGNVIDPAADTAVFSGVSVRPAVVAVSVAEGLGEITVTFNKPVKQVNPAEVDDALHIHNYAITGSTLVEVVSVASVSASSVRLTTTGQALGGSYTLKIYRVEDLANNAVVE